MKRSIVLAALLLSNSALFAAAQTPPAAPAPATAAAPSGTADKIAVIGFQMAVSQTNEFQKSFGALQTKWEPKRQELKKLSDDIDASTKTLQTDGAKLSDADRAARTHDLDDKKKKLDRDAQDAQNDFQQELQELYSNTATKVFDVLSDYVKKNGYTLVLDASGQQTPILYALPSTDITKAIVNAYNVKSGVAAPPPAAPTPAGAVPSAPKPAPKGPSGR